MMNSYIVKLVKERWKTSYTQNMREIYPACDQKIIPQTHVSLGALKAGFSTKVDLQSVGLHRNHEAE